MRVWAVSDIHTDYAQNLEWVRALAAGGGGSVAGLSRDVLLVAGDVSDDLATLEKTLQPLVDAFAHVFFVPGNHGEAAGGGGGTLCGRSRSLRLCFTVHAPSPERLLAPTNPVLLLKCADSEVFGALQISG